MKINVRFIYNNQIWFQEVNFNDKWEKIDTHRSDWSFERDGQGRWNAYYRKTDTSQLRDNYGNL